jgi:hypothetical protein
MSNPTRPPQEIVEEEARFIAEFITSKNIELGRGDGNVLAFFNELGNWHYLFTLESAREHAGILVRLKNLYGLWNALVDDEIDQRGTRHQLDASMQLLLSRTGQGVPAPEKDCPAVHALRELFTQLDATRPPNREHMLEAFHFDLWDLMNGFGYEYSINKLARLANSEEYSKYSTMTASIKQYLDLDCIYAAQYPSAADYRHLRVGYEHLGRAIKFASDIGTLKRELKDEDNFNLVRILALESGLTTIEQRVESDEQYEALMNQDALKQAVQEVRKRAETELNAARSHLEQATAVDTRMVLKGVTRFIDKYTRQDQLAPTAPTAPAARRSAD